MYKPGSVNSKKVSAKDCNSLMVISEWEIKNKKNEKKIIIQSDNKRKFSVGNLQKKLHSLFE